jgi:hypothetical protein
VLGEPRKRQDIGPKELLEFQANSKVTVGGAEEEEGKICDCFK